MVAWNRLGIVVFLVGQKLFFSWWGVSLATFFHLRTFFVINWIFLMIFAFLFIQSWETFGHSWWSFGKSWTWNFFQFRFFIVSNWAKTSVMAYARTLFFTIQFFVSTIPILFFFKSVKLRNHLINGTFKPIIFSFHQNQPVSWIFDNF